MMLARDCTHFFTRFLARANVCDTTRYRRLHLSLRVAVAASLTAREFSIRRVGGSALRPALYDRSGGGGGGGEFEAVNPGINGGTVGGASSAETGEKDAGSGSGVLHGAVDALRGGVNALQDAATILHSGGVKSNADSGNEVHGDLNETSFLLTFTVKNETPGECRTRYIAREFFASLF